MKEKLLKKAKNQRGSVTVFVLTTCMFFIIILLLVNIGLINKKANQEKQLEKISKNYAVKEEDMEKVYKELVGDNQYITKEQLKELILASYPIGSIYFSTQNESPESFMGGKWVSYAEGRTLVGEGTDTDVNGTMRTFTRYDDPTEAQNKGGEYTHKLQLAEIPSHTHSLASGSVSRASLVGCIWNYVVQSASNPGSASGIVSKYKVDSTLRIGGSTITANDGIKIDASHNHTLSGNTGATGSTGTHNNIQPYIVTYMWKRIE